MGHAIYTRSDPRAVMLNITQKPGRGQGYLDDFGCLSALKADPFGVQRIQKNRPGNLRGVDLYSGLVYRMLDIPVDYTPSLPARVAGWCAANGGYATARRIIRPGYKCIERARQYKPLTKDNQRSPDCAGVLLIMFENPGRK